MIYHFNPKTGFGVMVRDVEMYELVKQDWAEKRIEAWDTWGIEDEDRCVSCRAKVDLMDTSTFELTFNYEPVCYFCCHSDAERVRCGPDDAYLCIECGKLLAEEEMIVEGKKILCPECEGDDVLCLSSSLKSHSKQK